MTATISVEAELLKYTAALLDGERAGELEELCNQDVSSILGESDIENVVEGDSRQVRPPGADVQVPMSGGHSKHMTGSSAGRLQAQEPDRNVGIVYSRRPSRDEGEGLVGRIQLFSASRKYQWRLDPPLHVRTLVIADSNLRMVEAVPAGWQLVVLPGAKFRHVIEAVERAYRSGRPRVEVAYLQVGVNHRDDVGLAEPEFRETLRQLKKIAVEVRYVGVSCDRRLPGRVRDHIEDANLV